MDDNASVVGKLLLQGKLELKTSLLIGSGEKADYVDMVVLKDANGVPFIPATSLTGALRHHFTDQVGNPEETESYRLFWGYTHPKGDSVQSALAVRDLTTTDEPQIVVRDGVRITSLGIADEAMKYDFEVVEPGVEFDLYLEVTLRKQFDLAEFTKIFTYLVQVLKDGELALGAMTTKGLGCVKLAQGFDCRYFDFTRRSDAIAWLASDFTGGTRLDIPHEWVFAPKGHDLAVEVDLALANSLIIRQYIPVGDADAVQLSSNKQWIISGTSLKGALKSRAKRIVCTLGGQIDLVETLFGPEPPKRQDTESTQDLFRSRVYVNEPRVYNAVAKNQTRVKVDRFTGGAVDGALFATEPLWAKSKDNKMVTVKLVVKNYEDWEAGLVLLLLKDLWTADLAIGGEKSIGRGTLKGLKAKIMFGDKLVEICEQNSQLGLSGTSQNDLQKYVDALVARCRKEVAICNQ